MKITDISNIPKNNKTYNGNTRKHGFTYVFDSMQDVCADIPLNVEYRRFYIEIVTLRYMCIVLRMDFEQSYHIVEALLENYA